jgi:S1-C subfamily serine protease
VGGAALNELSYQQARNYSMPVRGVYVAHPGYIGNQARLQKGSIIMAINGTPTPTLRDFVSAIAGVPHGEQVGI